MELILCHHGILGTPRDFASIQKDIQSKKRSVQHPSDGGDTNNNNNNNNNNNGGRPIVLTTRYRSTVELLSPGGEDDREGNRFPHDADSSPCRHHLPTYAYNPRINQLLHCGVGVRLAAQRLFFEFIFMFRELLLQIEKKKQSSQPNRSSHAVREKNENKKDKDDINGEDNGNTIFISLIGHSFGGVILREFIYLLFMLEEKTFIDLLQFHLGLLPPPPSSSSPSKGNYTHPNSEGEVNLHMKDQRITNTLIFYQRYIFKKDGNEEEERKDVAKSTLKKAFGHTFHRNGVNQNSLRKHLFEEFVLPFRGEVPYPFSPVMNRYRIRFRHFISIASPHCGLLWTRPSLVPTSKPKKKGVVRGEEGLPSPSSHSSSSRDSLLCSFLSFILLLRQWWVLIRCSFSYHIITHLCSRSVKELYLLDDERDRTAQPSDSRPILNNYLVNPQHLSCFSYFRSGSVRFYANYQGDCLVSGATASTLLELFLPSLSPLSENMDSRRIQAEWWRTWTGRLTLDPQQPSLSRVIALNGDPEREDEDEEEEEEERVNLLQDCLIRCNEESFGMERSVERGGFFSPCFYRVEHHKSILRVLHMALCLRESFLQQKDSIKFQVVFYVHTHYHQRTLLTYLPEKFSALIRTYVVYVNHNNNNSSSGNGSSNGDEDNHNKKEGRLKRWIELLRAANEVRKPSWKRKGVVDATADKGGRLMEMVSKEGENNSVNRPVLPFFVLHSLVSLRGLLVFLFSLCYGFFYFVRAVLAVLRDAFLSTLPLAHWLCLWSSSGVTTSVADLFFHHPTEALN